jgi:hypothetical protein
VAHSFSGTTIVDRPIDEVFEFCAAGSTKPPPRLPNLPGEPVVRPSARNLVQFNADDCIGTIGVITQHVVLDLVVVREAEFAVGTLAGWFVHASIFADTRLRQPGSNDTLSWDC